jgi:hypothetical protein
MTLNLKLGLLYFGALAVGAAIYVGFEVQSYIAKKNHLAALESAPPPVRRPPPDCSPEGIKKLAAELYVPHRGKSWLAPSTDDLIQCGIGAIPALLEIVERDESDDSARLKACHILNQIVAARFGIDERTPEDDIKRQECQKWLDEHGRPDANMLLERRRITAAKWREWLKGEAEFRRAMSAKFDRLERDFSTAPDPLPYEHVRDCKRLVREDILMSCRTDADAKVFVDLAPDRIRQGKTFRYFEYYLLWLGARAFEAYPPQDLRFWDALATKIDACEHAPGNTEVNNEVAGMAASVMVDIAFEYPGPSHYKDGVIDWAGWRKFADWYRANRATLVFDGETKRFKVRS